MWPIDCLLLLIFIKRTSEKLAQFASAVVLREQEIWLFSNSPCRTSTTRFLELHVSILSITKFGFAALQIIEAFVQTGNSRQREVGSLRNLHAHAATRIWCHQLAPSVRGCELLGHHAGLCAPGLTRHIVFVLVCAESTESFIELRPRIADIILRTRIRQHHRRARGTHKTSNPRAGILCIRLI